MATFLTVLHIVISLLLVIIILVFQQGKGADAGAAFGGTSQAMFGGRGSATFMNKLTTFAAVVFMCTSLGLAVVSSKTANETVFSDEKIPEIVDPVVKKDSIEGAAEELKEGAAEDKAEEEVVEEKVSETTENKETKSE